jgi:hypothetical protein
MWSLTLKSVGVRQTTRIRCFGGGSPASYVAAHEAACMHTEGPAPLTHNSSAPLPLTHARPNGSERTLPRASPGPKRTQASCALILLAAPPASTAARGWHRSGTDRGDGAGLSGLQRSCPFEAPELLQFSSHHRSWHTWLPSPLHRLFCLSQPQLQQHPPFTPDHPCPRLQRTLNALHHHETTRRRITPGDGKRSCDTSPVASLNQCRAIMSAVATPHRQQRSKATQPQPQQSEGVSISGLSNANASGCAAVTSRGLTYRQQFAEALELHFDASAAAGEALRHRKRHWQKRPWKRMHVMVYVLLLVHSPYNVPACPNPAVLLLRLRLLAIPFVANRRGGTGFANRHWQACEEQQHCQAAPARGYAPQAHAEVGCSSCAWHA